MGAIIAAQTVHTNHNFKPMSMDIMRDMIYSEDSDLNTLTLKPFNGERTELIESLLDNMYKLTVLANSMKKFSEDHVKSHVQPYFDEKQHFRCYLSDSYIVVEVTSNPTTSGSWRHIIENHGADKKNTKRYHDFSIIPNLSEKTLSNINDGLLMIIETVEQHIYSVMHKTNTIFEQVNDIRIGSKSEEEIRREERIRADERKRLEEIDAVLKKESRKKFWHKLIPTSSKITFN